MNPLGIHALVWVGGFSREECEYAVQSTRQAGFDILEIPALDPEAIDLAHSQKSFYPIRIPVSYVSRASRASTPKACSVLQLASRLFHRY